MTAPVTRIIGCDIGGTKTAVVVGTTEGVIERRTQFATLPARGWRVVLDELQRHITDARASAPDAHAVSVSIGGPLDVLKGIIKSPPNLPGWDDVPLKEVLARETGLPVFVEHDGNAGALAEHFFGAGRGVRNMLFLTMGTGLGAGLILDGRLYRGTTDTAGEIGHIRIADDGPDCYGKRGSLEGFGSGTGIALLADAMYPGRWKGGAPEVYEAWRSGSPEARQVFDRAARAFGRGLALLVDLLNPERIVLGGLGMRIAEALVVPALAELRREALPAGVAACAVVPAALGERIGDVASLCAAIDQEHLPHDPT
jgi:glucokinase